MNLREPLRVQSGRRRLRQLDRVVLLSLQIAAALAGPTTHRT
jgi:hypothetical protein